MNRESVELTVQLFQPLALITFRFGKLDSFIKQSFFNKVGLINQTPTDESSPYNMV